MSKAWPGEVLVGLLCRDAHVDLVVAHATPSLKAGGAYVPLDPAYPTEDRLRLCWTNSARRGGLGGTRRRPASPAGLLLKPLRVELPRHRAARRAASAELPELPPRLRAEIFDPRAPGGRGEDSPALPGAASDLAYVIYTSGSTGRAQGA